MTDPTPTPEIPARFTDSRPVVLVGTVAWVIVTAVVLFNGDRWSAALPTCYTGIAVGALAYTIFWIQRRAARRGSKGAQRGLL